LTYLSGSLQQRMSVLTAIKRSSGRAMSCMVVLMFLAAPAFAINLIPVDTTGQDVDIIFENDGSPAVTAGNELGSRWFFEDGLLTSGSPTPLGLPVSPARQITGVVAPTTGNTIDYVFNDYSANNALMFKASNTTAKSLTLSTPAKYGQLAFVYSGGSLGTTVVPVDYTINYTGGATQTGSFSAIDWSVTTLPTAVDRLTVADRANSGPVLDGSRRSATRWAVYVNEVATTNPTTNIESVTFNTTYTTPTGADVAILGLAGSGDAPVLGDTDGDGIGGEYPDDFDPIKNNFRKVVTMKSQGDLVRNNFVDFADFRQWKAAAMASGTSLEGIDFNFLGSVPEPSTAVLVLIGLVGLGARRVER
jgi:hypothetical protein